MKAARISLVAAIASLLCLDCGAADPPSDGRSTPGTVVPSSGTTAGESGKSEPAASAAGRANSAGSPRRTTADCAALRKRYAESQACFAPYRLANGGMKPEAFKRCREVPDPALTCGPETASPH